MKRRPPSFLRRRLVLFWFLLAPVVGVLSAGQAQAAPPVNDAFASASALSGLPVTATATNAEASLEAGEPDETEGDGGTSVWWTWTAPISGWVDIDTFDSDFDTVLAVYTGSTLATLNLVGWNDQAGGDQSRLKFQAAAGTVYRIQIQGWTELEGAIKLSLQATTAPMPPVLERITFTPGTVDVSSGRARLTVEMEFTAVDFLQGVNLVFTGPDGDEVTPFFWVADGVEFISGDEQGGVMRFETSIPANRAPGVWQVSVELTDQIENQASYGSDGHPVLPAGSTTSITVVNTGLVDALPPVISAATVTPNPVDVTTGSQSVTVRITASDDVSVGHLSLSFQSPTNEQVPYLSLDEADLISGTTRSGVWEGTLSIPAFAAPALWTITYNTGDFSEHSSYYGEDVEDGDLPLPAGVQGTLTIQNSGPVDTEGPQLTAITASRTTVDVTSASQTVEISATFQDSPSGLQQANISLNGPTGVYTAYQGLYFGMAPYPTTPVNTTATITIPRFLPPGNYRWTANASDGSGHSSSWNSQWGDSQDYPVGFQGFLTVQNSGPVDIAGPVLTAISADKTTVDVSAGDQTVLISATLQDAPAGLNNASVSLHGIDNAYVAGTSLFSGADPYPTGAMAVSGAVSIPGNLSPGLYIWQLSATDAGGKSSYYGYTSNQSFPAGFSGTLTITKNSAPTAYNAWRAARPGLAGDAHGLPAANPDGDDLPNAVEFLCGTDPLIHSRAGGADPAASRAPVYTLTPTHLRVEYRLSAANAALGSGNAMGLQPQSTLNPSASWSPVTPALVNDDLWRAEIPLTAGTRHFLRFAVTP